MKRFLKILGLIVAVMAAGMAMAFPLLKRHQESVQCGNSMVSLCCAARIWAAESGGRLPSNLLSMSNEIIVPKILICPADRSRQAAAGWATFSTNNSSYEVVTAGLQDGDVNGVFLRCGIHGHLGYADGTVFDGTRRRTKVCW